MGLSTISTKSANWGRGGGGVTRDEKKYNVVPEKERERVRDVPFKSRERGGRDKGGGEREREKVRRVENVLFNFHEMSFLHAKPSLYRLEEMIGSM